MHQTTKRWHSLRRGIITERDFVLSFLEETTPADAVQHYSQLPEEVQHTIRTVLQQAPLDDWSKMAWCGVVFAHNPDAEDDDVIRSRRVAVAKLILSETN